jgi:hypothetical protein
MKKNNEPRATRLKTKIPVAFAAGKGITRDVSTTGIYFETDQSFKTGQPIMFTLNMEHIDASGAVLMKCFGEIVRVEENGKKIGVAATISSYSFETLAPSTDDVS